ncbi:unnamed protein product [Protopolystoma xenopodis]|uniref:Uncharacterized protein n=1 Tax=Protopolystoma xenopodis TaxID=117903 RepID=A0A3S5CIL2_9PLAT|nr:unnamed protein product [Protopolystoma xenopodis]
MDIFPGYIPHQPSNTTGQMACNNSSSIFSGRSSYSTTFSHSSTINVSYDSPIEHSTNEDIEHRVSYSQRLTKTFNIAKNATSKISEDDKNRTILLSLNAERIETNNGLSSAGVASSGFDFLKEKEETIKSSVNSVQMRRGEEDSGVEITYHSGNSVDSDNEDDYEENEDYYEEGIEDISQYEDEGEMQCCFGITIDVLTLIPRIKAQTAKYGVKLPNLLEVGEYSLEIQVSLRLYFKPI